MRLSLGRFDNATPNQARIFADIDGNLVDPQLAYAAYVKEAEGNGAAAYDLASCYFPGSIAAFLEGGEAVRQALDRTVAFLRERGFAHARGPGGEKLVYDPSDIRLLPPLENPQRSIVVGFSDRARAEATPEAEIPTGYYKLPRTFIADGAPIIWPKFSDEVDADACLAVVIGKPGTRIQPGKAWDHVAGLTLLIDITARDINRREGLTTNNLLGKNFPTSTCLGPALLLTGARNEIEAMEIELGLDGVVKQRFTLRECVFGIEQIIAHYSNLGLRPGDFFAIGASMALRGGKLLNPMPLKIGTTLRCSSRAIGELSHPVISAARRVS